MNDKLKHSILKKKQEALRSLQLVNCFQFLNFTEKVSTHVKQVKIKILLGYSLKFIRIWQLRKFIFLVSLMEGWAIRHNFLKGQPK